ncbi:unnamed protein product [Urochloa humidicola]
MKLDVLTSPVTYMVIAYLFTKKIWYLQLHVNSPTCQGGLKVQNLWQGHMPTSKEKERGNSTSTEAPFDSAYFAKLCTVATYITDLGQNFSHYTGPLKKHTNGTVNTSIIPCHEHCYASTDDVEPGLLLLESLLEAHELQITSANLHLDSKY